MDIRVVALRAVTLIAVNFGRKILENTLQELDELSRRSRCRPKQKHARLRIIQGGRK